ncbi:hypothetical protein NUW54_g11012 [Trametes sanguinea]|uniref:Uncharacterized protein n=1 Tax=Trametes sanguinea TaxID=158606 RepID=A0ACC1NN98_9APHY|nr:hypothetical protein NUW54_g11012 [Trametes sanguinea]
MVGQDGALVPRPPEILEDGLENIADPEEAAPGARSPPGSSPSTSSLWHTYEDADAMLVMPYKSLRVDENFPGRKDLGRLLKLLINRSFMVFGPTAWALRDPGVRQKQKAVIHPYRIVPRDPSEPLPPPIPYTLPASMRAASTQPAAPAAPEVEMKDD